MESTNLQTLSPGEVEMESTDLQILNSSEVETDPSVLNSHVNVIGDYNNENDNVYKIDDDDLELQEILSTRLSFIRVRTLNQALITLLVQKLKE